MGVTRAIYPGSFDPVTLGHLDIIQRARQLFDSLIVAVAENEAKSALFTAEERIVMIEEALGGGSGVIVKRLDGLLVDFAKAEAAFVVIRGLRAISDFEFEFQMALMNRRLEPRLETIFLTPKEDYTFLSSRIVKEVGRLGGDVTPFVPPAVVLRLKSKFSGEVCKERSEEATPPRVIPCA
jgi:pantetheine-phosphate adenylyltransferase